MKKRLKGIAVLMIMVLTFGALSGCGKNGSDEVVIYTNGDEEAIVAMKNALDSQGYGGKYIVQSFGTSELGGKLLAEGDAIEANVVTMSSYFIESAQNQHGMFEDLHFETGAIGDYPSYYTPILAITGSIFVNTKVIEENGLEMPKSVKDLTKPEYKGLVSIPSIMDSSTAWLLIQSIISEYGEAEGLLVTRALVENCGAHVESSGSGPIKKVRVGEVAAGFGLRHQAVADKKEGKPVEFIDPKEGNFSLTESVAVVRKDDEEISKLSMQIAEVIVKNARKELIENYPVALYDGETVDQMNRPTNAKNFEKPLTVELLKEHQEFFQSALSK